MSDVPFRAMVQDGIVGAGLTALGPKPKRVLRECTETSIISIHRGLGMEQLAANPTFHTLSRPSLRSMQALSPSPPLPNVS